MRENLNHEATNSQEPSIFKFEEFNLRVVDQDGNPWFVARDVGEALGITHSGVRDITRKIKDKHKGVVSIDTNKGERKTTIISEHGLYKMLIQSRKPKAEEFQDWVTEKVIPSIRKTGSYHKSGMAKARWLLQQAQLMVEQEERMARQEERFAIQEKGLYIQNRISRDHEERLSEIENRRERAQEEIRGLPEPSIEVAEKSTRSHINQKVRQFAQSADLEFRELWNTIYTEFKYRYHIDVKLRAANRGMSPMDYLESIDMLDELYAVTSIICNKMNS